MKRLYLAGPDVFMPGAAALATAKKAICAQYGFLGLHPFDNEAPACGAPKHRAMAIYRGNLALMAGADAIVADLTPFRGPSADPGTVFELGWMISQGRPAFAYSLAAAGFRERTIAALGVAGLDAGRWSDGAGAAIEDFGLGDNLMIDCALLAGGFAVVTPDAAGPAACFERCLQAARGFFDAGGNDRQARRD